MIRCWVLLLGIGLALMRSGIRVHAYASWISIKLLAGIDGNYRVITLILKKYGNLPLCLENYALFWITPIFQIYSIHIHLVI